MIAAPPMIDFPPQPGPIRPSPLCRAWAFLLLALLGAGGGCGGDEGSTHGPPPAVVRAVASAPPAPRPNGPLDPEASCVNAGCHASLATSRFVHGVIRGGQNCMTCHAEDQGGHVFPQRRAGIEGCTFCHDSVTGHRIHQHQATNLDCLACHDPHASEHGSLLRAASTATLCGTCHPPDATAVSHPPYTSGECTACHDPHESDFAGLLRGGEGAEHCYLCHEHVHDVIATASVVHPPAAEDCSACHLAHGSAHAHVLAEPIDENCFSCHQDIEQSIAAVTSPHGALSLDAKCANCHDPHASNQPNLLKAPQNELCLDYHDTEIETVAGRTIPDMSASLRDREFLHGPVKGGDCSACHKVHGGSQTRLLTEEFTEEFYTSFDIKHYALCFQCHDQALVTEERTSALTNFRDGDLNLHYLHVNRDDKGRTCRACHEMHGSDLPAHIAEAVPFGNSNWPLPIGFEMRDTGGSCAPGCHKPMSYDRVVPTWGVDE
ncbi:MAG: cytochrome c3 family protein [Planctomycetota bacterium]